MTIQKKGTSDNHIKAQKKIMHLLSNYYRYANLEYEVPVPNKKRHLDKTARPTKDYKLDVFVESPMLAVRHLVPYQRLGIELDGDVGHKRTKKQYKKDEDRSNDIEEHYGIHIVRFDTQEVIGFYVNPKTMERIPHLHEQDILERCGIIRPLPEHRKPAPKPRQI